MNTRRRHGLKNSQEGVYTGPSQTQSQVDQTLETPLTMPLSLTPPVDTSSSSCRDRTSEFQSVCKSLQGRQVRRSPDILMACCWFPKNCFYSKMWYTFFSLQLFPISYATVVLSSYSMFQNFVFHFFPYCFSEWCTVH